MAEEKKQEKEQQIIMASMSHRVSMAEVDAHGVMYHSRIFEVFERGRIELLRALGFEYRDLYQRKNIIMPTVEVACRYMAPIVYDDLLTVETAITGITPQGIRFDYRVTRDGVVLAVGFSQHIFIDPQGRPVNFGKTIFEELKKKGLIKEEKKEEPPAKKEQEDVAEKLRRFVSERVEEKPN